MGSPCELRFFGDDTGLLESVARKAIERIEGLEKKYSRYLQDSVITAINLSAGKNPVSIDEETYYLLQYAATCFNQSDGLFDVTSGVLRSLWRKDMQRLPSRTELESCLVKVGFNKIQLQEGSVYLPLKGMEIDFGGVVKEYTSDVVAGLAQTLGVDAGVVNLGGDLNCFGRHPFETVWSIGIAHPQDPSSPIATINIDSGSVTTSGSYERFFEVGGERYSHLLDPRTGWPVKGMMSVSIVAEQAVVAGSLASIAMLKDKEDAISWLESLEVPFLAVDQDCNCYGDIVA